MNDTKQPEPGPPASGHLVISRERFDSVPGLRAQYILLYGFVFVFWAYMTFTQAYFIEIPAEPIAVEAGDAASPEALDTETEATTEDRAPAPRYEVVWTPKVVAFQVFIGVCMLLFYIQFFRAMRIMGYPILMIVAFGAMVFLPVPGILAIAVIDRQLGKAWHNANPDSKERRTA